MKRLTTDSAIMPSEAMLNFAHTGEDSRVKLGPVGGGVDLCERISEYAKEYQTGCDITAESVMEGGCVECDCPLAMLNLSAIQAAELRGRLKKIEDILGDDYDLDHLRELVEDERNGRLFLTPVNPGDSVYWLLEDDGWYISDPEKVADVGTKGFFLGNLDGSMCDCPSFVPWDQLGKDVFLSHEEAEAALAKMKEG